MHKISTAKDNFINATILEAFKNGQVVALTGAGISEESGIPTFRGENGLWSRYDPQLYAYPEGLLSVLRNDPDKIVDYLDDLYSILFRAKPNPAHLVLARMEKDKILKCVITQNIDNLHQDAGSDKVLELHGNAFRLRCDNCSKAYRLEKDNLSHIIEQLRKGKGSRQAILKALSRFFPRCDCKDRLRIDIVLFGELLPSGVLEESYREMEHCSLLVLIGTSGVVYPAASLPFYAKDRGIKILEINSVSSNLSAICDFQLLGKAGEILPQLVKQLN